MKGKGKKFIIGVVCAVLGVIGLFGMFSETEDKGALLCGSIILIIVGVVLVFLDKKLPDKPKPASHPTIASPVPTPAPSKTPDGMLNYNLFEDVEQEAILCYEYEENLCISDGAINLISGNGGKFISFKQESENPHDKNAVCIYLNNNKIGYMYRGNIQDMYNDYAKRGWLVLGYVNKYSVDDNKATYKIGFYKPLDTFESKEFKLSKTSKKIDEHSTRQDYLCRCNVGDIVDINFDCDNEIYIISSDDEIGELPKSASAFICEGNYKKLVCIISNCDTDDNDKIQASVIVYIVK